MVYQLQLPNLMGAQVVRTHIYEQSVLELPFTFGSPLNLCRILLVVRFCFHNGPNPSSPPGSFCSRPR
jgi:hypothetical protein